MPRGTDDLLKALNARGKSSPLGHSYVLEEGKYAIDAFIDPGVLRLDEARMGVYIPFADGRTRDGVGDLLEIGGIDCSRHVQNPIALYDHGKAVTLPVGLASDPDTGGYTVELDQINKHAGAWTYFYSGKGIDGVSRAAEHEHALFCEQLYDLMARKFVRGGSIGYTVINARELPPDHSTGTPKGLHLLAVKMLELSAVVLPANQDTVIKSLDDWERGMAETAREILAMPGVCGKSLSRHLVKSLTPFAEAVSAKETVAFGAPARAEKAPPPRCPYRTGDWVSVKSEPFDCQLCELELAGTAIVRAGDGRRFRVKVTDLGAPSGLRVDKKSLDAVRKKYRPMKSLRRRTRRASAGSGIVYVGEKDMDLLAERAKACGVGCDRIGQIPRGHKVRLSGSDEAIDMLAREFGRPMHKAITSQKSKALERPMRGEEEMMGELEEPEENGGSLDDGAGDGGEVVEPYGAQILRRLHDDHSMLMQDYDSMMGPLEHEGVKGLLQQHLEHKAGFLDELEKAFGEHYPDLEPLGGGGEDDAEGEGEGEAGGADEEPAEEEGMDDLDDLDEPSDMDDEPVEEEEEEPAEEEEDPEENPVPKGKSLQGLRDKYNKGQTPEQARAKEQQRAAKRGQLIRKVQAQAQAREVNRSGKAIRRTGRRTDSEGAARQDESWDEHEYGHITGATKFLKSLSAPDSRFDEDERMESHHYHKCFEGIGQVRGWWGTKAVSADDKQDAYGPDYSLPDHGPSGTGSHDGGTIDLAGGPMEESPEGWDEKHFGKSRAPRKPQKPPAQRKQPASQTAMSDPKPAKRPPTTAEHRQAEQTRQRQVDQASRVDAASRRRRDYPSAADNYDSDPPAEPEIDETDVHDPRSEAHARAQAPETPPPVGEEPFMPGKSMPPHAKSLKEASDFFRDLSREKAFGDPHRDGCAKHCKALEEMTRDMDDPVLGELEDDSDPVDETEEMEDELDAERGDYPDRPEGEEEEDDLVPGMKSAGLAAARRRPAKKGAAGATNPGYYKGLEQTLKSQRAQITALTKTLEQLNGIVAADGHG